MRNKRIEYDGLFVKKEYESIQEHIRLSCEEFIMNLLTDDMCKDFIIPDLETHVMGHLYCAISDMAIDEAYADCSPVIPNDAP